MTPSSAGSSRSFPHCEMSSDVSAAMYAIDEDSCLKSFCERFSSVSASMLVTSTGSVDDLIPRFERSSVLDSALDRSRRSYSLRYRNTPGMPCLKISAGGTDSESSSPSMSTSLRFPHLCRSHGSERSGFRATASCFSCTRFPSVLGSAIR